jgi:predicted metal-dependent phosphotriesterase family hydrolase
VITNSHDHLFFRSAQLPGQELDDKEAAIAELAAFRALGGQRVVQWTPFGLGRRAEWLAEVSQASGVHIIGATGLHQRAHYADQALVDEVLPRLAELFIEELTVGMRPDAPDEPPGPRAGLIKVAGAFHHLDEHARVTMIAAAQAHHATGAPIGVHHELGTAAPDVADLLIGELRVPPEKVILGHLNRQPDSDVHLELAQTGAFLAFDGPSRANHATDWRLFECLERLAAHGHADQVLIGADTTTAAARGAPGMPFLLRQLAPRLGPNLSDKFFSRNPARAFPTP